MAMISGVHALIYTRNADAVRSFFRDVLGRDSVDAGDGWLIFALPPSELAVHPTDGPGRHELYLMCDDVEAAIRELAAKGVECGPITDEGWGLVTSIKLADGEAIGLYQPRHPTAIPSP
jgi:catechol 2,3-dioxygenase-like lactoylglutathione lyase family enzyme